jgi:hypothetical protein
MHTKLCFCHRNHFFVFHNEHAQSTNLGPKLMFGLISRNFVAAHHPFRKRVSGAYKARVFATGTISSFFRNEHAHSTTLVPKLMFGLFSRNSVAARHPFRKRVSGAYKLSFCHRNHFFVFRNEHAQSTNLSPKLMFGIVSHNFMPHVTHSENGYRGAYQARVFATGTVSSIFATNMPNPLI